MAELVSIASGQLAATISSLGAELQSLTDCDGRELMTNADPAYWTGRAPLLFPIVGQLHLDQIRIDGAIYPMKKHGFARRSVFECIEQSESSAYFRMVDNDDTRAQYPFAFELDARYEIDGATLFQTVTIRNPSGQDLPFSFGFHPAFAWPLPYGAVKDDHFVRFACDEPAEIAVLTPAGTVAPDRISTPVDGDIIRLRDSLFADDALIWPDLESRHLVYGAPHGATLEIDFPDTPMLGIWTKPGSAFLCIEPWAGLADPASFNGDFRDKPGVMALAPGGERSFRMNVTLAS